MSSNPQLTSNPNLFVSEIQDVYIRQNFDRLRQYFNAQNQLLNFKFVELNFTGPEANRKVPHGLGVAPQDILVTHLTGGGKVTFNFGLFDTTNMDISVDAACRVRLFYGTYWNFTSQVNDPSSATMTVSGA